MNELRRLRDEVKSNSSALELVSFLEEAVARDHMWTADHLDRVLSDLIRCVSPKGQPLVSMLSGYDNCEHKLDPMTENTCDICGCKDMSIRCDICGCPLLNAPPMTV